MTRYCGFWFCLSMGFLCVQMCVSASKCVSCAFSLALFLLFCLFGPTLVYLFLFYLFFLFHHYPLEVYYFLRRDRKAGDLGSGGEELGEGKHNQNMLCEKNPFSIKKMGGVIKTTTKNIFKEIVSKTQLSSWWKKELINRLMKLNWYLLSNQHGRGDIYIPIRKGQCFGLVWFSRLLTRRK